MATMRCIWQRACISRGLDRVEPSLSRKRGLGEGGRKGGGGGGGEAQPGTPGLL